MDLKVVVEKSLFPLNGVPGSPQLTTTGHYDDHREVFNCHMYISVCTYGT